MPIRRTTAELYRGRFLAVYAALALTLAASAAGAYVGVTARSASPTPRCWTSGPDVPAALYRAAFCRFGKANVRNLGWMPHIQANGYPSATLDEVAVLGPRTAPTYWLARVVSTPHVTRVRVWTRCGTVC